MIEHSQVSIGPNHMPQAGECTDLIEGLACSEQIGDFNSILAIMFKVRGLKKEDILQYIAYDKYHITNE